eukprot:Rhum_TRINITY_DN9331_c0_g1::Rhum_TRINITY_DN9331_c0_g1_i1::g.32982::m.32982
MHRRPFRRAHLQHRLHQLVEQRRLVRHLQRCRLPPQVVAHRPQRVAPERKPAERHRVQRDAERPAVSCLTLEDTRPVLPLEGLGRHEGGCAGEACGDEALALHVDALRDAEVGQLHLPVLAEQDVRRLDVPVHNLPVMHVLEPAGDGDGVALQQPQAQRLCRVHRRVDLPALHVLRQDEELRVRLRVPDALHDVRVVQVLQDRYLVLHCEERILLGVGTGAPTTRTIHHAGAGHAVLGEDLHSVRLVADVVHGEEDAPEAARPEEGHHRVVVEDEAAVGAAPLPRLQHLVRHRHKPRVRRDADAPVALEPLRPLLARPVLQPAHDARTPRDGREVAVAAGADGRRRRAAGRRHAAAPVAGAACAAGDAASLGGRQAEGAAAGSAATAAGTRLRVELGLPQRRIQVVGDCRCRRANGPWVGHHRGAGGAPHTAPHTKLSSSASYAIFIFGAPPDLLALNEVQIL